MIVIWGYRTHVRLLGMVTFICAACQNPAAQRAEEVVRRFALFGVPLFPFSRRTRVTCTFCGSTMTLDKERSARLRQDIAAHDDGQYGTSVSQPEDDPRPYRPGLRSREH